MVKRLARRLLKGAVALLSAILPRLDTAQRKAVAAQLVEAAFVGDFDRSFLTVGRVLAQRKLDIGQRERLLSAAFSGLNATSVPAALLERFSSMSGGSLHYSQDGEDIVLNRLLGERGEGFYVDIGAHHATRFSNTFSLYRRGWRGINVDATPGSMTSFRALRPRDINLELFISDRNEPLRMHLFREGALNTANTILAQTYVSAGWEKTGEVELLPKTLTSVMDEHVPAGEPIDLLTIDVEGEELAVLRSGNWEAYRPAVIVIEALSTPLGQLLDEPAVRFLIGLGYEPRFRLFNSVVFAQKTT
ncbi:FkbM family methyltransferase [Bradyrhizobium liaoningense]|uniref:FkbM family methyltransferase n=1 Tax=Bradyrhizobium liaoningense TaxID=43992 RepID=UPI001BA9BEE7|nr:FkbM family methyltransferase [Bradyrhizobium liaoningense]MBR0843863.1 FkbM family methyltransferase [Bradyrhizobium liaoningense]